MSSCTSAPCPRSPACSAARPRSVSKLYSDGCSEVGQGRWHAEAVHEQQTRLLTLGAPSLQLLLLQMLLFSYVSVHMKSGNATHRWGHPRSNTRELQQRRISSPVSGQPAHGRPLGPGLQAAPGALAKQHINHVVGAGVLRMVSWLESMLPQGNDEGWAAWIPTLAHDAHDFASSTI